MNVVHPIRLADQAVMNVKSKREGKKWETVNEKEKEKACWETKQRYTKAEEKGPAGEMNEGQQSIARLGKQKGQSSHNGAKSSNYRF